MLATGCVSTQLPDDADRYLPTNDDVIGDLQLTAVMQGSEVEHQVRKRPHPVEATNQQATSEDTKLSKKAETEL